MVEAQSFYAERAFASLEGIYGPQGSADMLEELSPAEWSKWLAQVGIPEGKAFSTRTDARDNAVSAHVVLNAGYHVVGLDWSIGSPQPLAAPILTWLLMKPAEAKNSSEIHVKEEEERWVSPNGGVYHYCREIVIGLPSGTFNGRRSTFAWGAKGSRGGTICGRAWSTTP